MVCICYAYVIVDARLFGDCACCIDVVSDFGDSAVPLPLPLPFPLPLPLPFVLTDALFFTVIDVLLALLRLFCGGGYSCIGE